MEREFWSLILRILIFLPFTLALIYLSLKIGGTKLQTLRNGKYMKVVEKISLSKDTSLLVVLIGDKGYVMSASSNNTEILLELTKEEVEIVSAQKPSTEFPDMRKWIEKIIKKEEKHE